LPVGVQAQRAYRPCERWCRWLKRAPRRAPLLSRPTFRSRDQRPSMRGGAQPAGSV